MSKQTAATDDKYNAQYYAIIYTAQTVDDYTVRRAWWVVESRLNRLGVWFRYEYPATGVTIRAAYTRELP